MPLKNLQILNFYQKPLCPKPNCLLAKRLCTLSDSDFPPTHDAPNSSRSSWLCNNQNTNFSDPHNFVSPFAYWVQHPNLETHKNFASPLLFEAKESDIQKVSELLIKQYPSEDGVVVALNESGISATEDLVSDILKRFSNQWNLAFGVFVWAKQQTGYVHSRETYDFIVDISGKCKKFSTMWELVEEMNGLNGYISLVTMSKVMRRLANAGKYKDAIVAFVGMEKFGLSKDVEALNVLMYSLVKGGSVKDAHAVLLEFKDSIPLNSSSFNILISGYCKTKMLHDARKTMDEMEGCGFRPDVVSYTCFVEIYCKEKNFQNAKAIFKEMQEKGIKPNVITYTIFMHALGKAGQLDEVREVVKEVKRSGCRPNAKFCSSLIYIFSQSGRLKDAWDVFWQMGEQGVGRDLVTYNTMISSACAHAQGDIALELLQRMEEDTCKPNVETYAPLLKLCCSMNDMKVLKFLLNHMFKNNVSIDLSTYTVMVNGFRVKGKLEHACFFFQEAVLKGLVPMDTTYKALVKELDRKNMAELKENIVKLMSLAIERKGCRVFGSSLCWSLEDLMNNNDAECKLH